MSYENSSDRFLTDREKDQIKRNYVSITEHIRPDDLMSQFVENNLMDVRQKNRIHRQDEHKQAQYIVDEIFLKATYNDLVKIRIILLKSGYSGHKIVADFLPHHMHDPETTNQGDDVIDCTYQPTGHPIQEQTTSFPVTEDDVTSKCESAPCAVITSAEMTGTDEEIIGTSGGGLSKKVYSSMLKSKSTSGIISSIGLPFYGVKQGNDPQFGKTLTVVLRNFTDDPDLAGYANDIELLREMGKTLKHQICIDDLPWNNKKLNNLTKEETFDVLKDIQNYLNDSRNNFDRFFLFYLSHGDMNGINTNKQGSKFEFEEDAKHNCVVIHMQEIVDMFTHNVVPELKGFPKVFVNQFCRGDKILKAAVRKEVNNSERNWSPPANPIAIGADVIICDSTSMGNYSWVGKRSSMYIGSFYTILNCYYQTETFYDILVEINNKISQMNQQGEDPKTKFVVPVSQMPAILSTLTKKFYLVCPS